MILESAHEAHFHEKSYGLRPGRRTHDAQKYMFNQLKRNCNGKNKKIIRLNIEKHFDRINHQSILDQIIAPQYSKHGLKHWIKTGVPPEYPAQSLFQP